MSLKARIAAGDTLLGTFVKTPHPHVVEVLAGTGLDLIVLDAEHAPFDRRDLDQCIFAARAGGMAVLVRPADASPAAILNALDGGADGIIAPHIRSAAEARALVKAAHYGPGGRGYAGSSRPAGYGAVSMAAHRAASELRTVVVAQIEDAEALPEIDAIAAVEGLDALFIGRADLTVALDCASPDEPAVIAAVAAICAAGRAARRPVGMFLARPGDTAAWIAQGATLFILGSDHGFLRSGAAALRGEAGLG